MRNGLKITKAGDKPYKTVEESPGFFQLEGIV